MKLRIALLTVTAAAGLTCRGSEGTDFLERLKAAPAKVILANGSPADPAAVKVEYAWKGGACRPRLRSTGNTTLRVGRVDLFDFQHGLPPDTRIYGEAFQMLAQTGGTLERPEDWGSYPDRSHYQLEEPDGLRTAHGALLLHLAGSEKVLLGFSSCRRFDGRLSFDGRRLLVSFDGEGMELAPGQTWEMEEFIAQSNPDREALFAALCARIERNHPRRKGFRAPPMGWCSWYGFGPGVTAENIRQNLYWIATNAPQLRYIQIDDGYQQAVGDWLVTNSKFPEGMKPLVEKIKAGGFTAGLWLAPFVCETKSDIYKNHQDWLLKDKSGKNIYLKWDKFFYKFSVWDLAYFYENASNV